jgi:hypothetical protein
MKKLLLLLAMAVLPLISNSQPLFGFTPSEVKDRYPGVDWTYKRWGDGDDKLSMGFRAEDLIVVYFFNENNKSIATTINPQTEGELQGIIERYNSRYVIIDSYTWKFYDEGSIFMCKLKQSDQGRYFFLWSLYD